MIVLFITYNIYHLVNRIIFKTKFCSANILSHVNGRTVTTKQQFLIQSVRSQIRPYGAVFLTKEKSFFQSFQDGIFSFQICLRLVIYLIEAYSQTSVCLIESCIYPFVHGLPQRTYFRISGFPTNQHFMCLTHKR